MSNTETKKLIIYLRASETTTKWKDDYTNELIRLINEMLPSVKLNRSGNQIEVDVGENFSKRTLKLRIKKFLHQKKLKDDFRVVSYNTSDNYGYQIIQKKVIELTYY